MIPTISKAAKSKTGQKLIKAAKKSAVKAGFSTASDVISGENVAQSMSKNFKKASGEVFKKMTSNRVKKPPKKNKNVKKQLYNFFQ